jgi:hypothetical protein
MGLLTRYLAITTQTVSLVIVTKSVLFTHARSIEPRSTVGTNRLDRWIALPEVCSVL